MLLTRSCRRLAEFADYKPCAAADTIAKAQLLAVRARLSRLKALESELERMIVQCAHGTIADCRVIEVLGDHANCAHDHHGGQEAAV